MLGLGKKASIDEAGSPRWETTPDSRDATITPEPKVQHGIQEFQEQVVTVDYTHKHNGVFLSPKHVSFSACVRAGGERQRSH